MRAEGGAHHGVQLHDPTRHGTPKFLTMLGNGRLRVRLHSDDKVREKFTVKILQRDGHRCDPFYVHIDRRLLVERPRPQGAGWDSAFALVLTCQCHVLPRQPPPARPL